MLAFIQHILVTILAGYIGLTNSLATYIEGALPALSRDVSLHTAPLREVSREAIKAYAPRILLENADFQQAAVIARTQREETHAIPADMSSEAYIEQALVNIYCRYETDTHIRTTTGTGFFVSPRGVILTNAHVAQFLLLEGAHDVVHNTECVIRTGNPATAQYRAKLLYISPTWVSDNAALVDVEAPRGTGERDYALLYVSESVSADTALPSTFPAITIDTDLVSRTIAGSRVLSAGYPAGHLAEDGPLAALEPRIAAATVGTLYTFGSNYADIFSLLDSPVGEHGASGGPVVSETNDAIGLIVTKGDTDAEGANSLRALTLSYIDRTIIEETGFSLAHNIMGDAAERGRIFENAIKPLLADMLAGELAE